MRVINVRKKNYFYSHAPGVSFIVPLTSVVIQFYPTRFVIQGKVYDLGFTGPVEKFTVQCDLDRNKLFMHGHALEGYFRIEIAYANGYITAMLKRAPLTYNSPLFKDRICILASMKTCQTLNREIVFLGSHKAPHIDALLEKKHLESIIPCLFMLGQGIAPGFDDSKGNASILKECSLLAANQTKKEFLSHFKMFIQSTFERCFVPKIHDDLFQGVSSSHAENSIYSPSILNGVYQLIRRGLIDASGKTISLLPFFSSVFATGKAINLCCSKVTISFAWSCKKLRAVHLNAHEPQTLSLKFPQGIKQGYIRRGAFGKRGLFKVDAPLVLEEPGLYVIDRLEK